MLYGFVIGVAGATGAVCRWLLDGFVQDRTSGSFPFGTLTVNVVGSLIFGLVTGFALGHAGSGTARLIIGTGFCGGLTTWSSASWETVQLAQNQSLTTAARFTATNLVASLAAAGVGLLIGW